MRVVETGRGRKSPLDERTLVPTETWAPFKDGKGGQWIGEDRNGSREVLLWDTTWEGSADKRWRPAGRGTVHVYGRSAIGRDGGKERVQRKIEAVLNSENWRGR